VRKLAGKFSPAVFYPTLRRAWGNFNHRYQTRKLFGRDAKFIPPVQLMHDGPPSYQEFKDNGEEFLRLYIELCGLKPDEHILDLGSGIGRKTLPLTHFLSQRGSYVGLDIVKSGVDWCTRKYTSRYANFTFQLIDVYNSLYNPGGKTQAADYRFPFSNKQFDFVVLNSVFTHMLPLEAENYLGEVARVLKTGGRCLVSYFLLNDESLSLIAAGRSSIDLRYELGPARSISPDQPERAIGYGENYVMQLFEKCGLAVKRPVAYGSWCGREKFYSYQDQIVAYKATTLEPNRPSVR
jgi:SAM-dependent methyltransferase